MQGFPDFQIDVQQQHDSADAITLEVIVRGTHRGELLGIPPTGKEITLAAMETYRLAGGKIAEQWVVIDALGLMQQLGAIGVPGQASP
ncbi:MAG: ester cyclase [Chloroflexota bacterium]